MLARMTMLVALVLAAPAQAQDTIVIALEGWAQEQRADGITYYRCASSACAAGSVLSYKEQPHRPALTLDQFESHHRGLAAQSSGQGRIKTASIGDFKERTLNGVRVLQVNRTVTWTDGTSTSSIEARLIGSERSYSLVSDSGNRKSTENNFERFLQTLAVVAGLKTR